jgi:nucleoside-diphosphate-sugar epimerase
MMRVMITGPTGFVGRHIMRALEIHNVALLPVVRAGKEPFLSGFRNVERIITTRDLFSENESWWEEKANGVDLVIHAAWYVEHGKYLQSRDNMTCLVGSLRLAEGVARAGVKRFVGLGTCAEYDHSSGLVSTETPLSPKSPYAASKAALFLALSSWCPTQSISFAWCRLFYIFGDGEDERRLVPYIHKRLSERAPVELTKGTQIRDFLDVAEAGRRIVNISLSDREGAFNVSSGIPKTVRQLVEHIADSYGRRDLLQFGSRPENDFDPPCIVGLPSV